jgi:3-methyladenine DNA glycosylase AlkD
MTAQEIINQLQALGNESIKKTLLKHGAREPFFGVKAEDLKKIQKKIKKNHELSLELYETGNSDAMYLAGLIADETKISKDDLNSWVKNAYWYYISEYAVPWVAAESPFGFELAAEWIQSDKETIASAGWATYSNLMMIKKDEEIDLKLISALLDKIEKEIHQSANRVKYTMNGFVIATGAFVKELHEKAISTASLIGKVKVDMGGTACKVPLATEYIKKTLIRTAFKKKKQARC